MRDHTNSCEPNSGIICFVESFEELINNLNYTLIVFEDNNSNECKIFYNIYNIYNIIKNCIQLINDLKKIHDSGIIHNDVHKNNIIYDCINDIFIYIDFDNSYFVEKDLVIDYINKERLKDRLNLYKDLIWFFLKK